ncbi:MAG: SRPBCC family protein [Caldilineaceae bacterium]
MLTENYPRNYTPQNYMQQGRPFQGNYRQQQLYPSQQMQRRSPNVDTMERQISVALGGGLVLYALLNRGQGMSSLFAGAVGAALIVHGQSSRSPFYDALNIDTNDHQRSNQDGDGQRSRDYLPEQRSMPSNTIEIKRAVTIDKPADELYNYWRKLENLPNFMKHLQEVTQTDEKHSHWVAKVTGGIPVSWDAEITEDDPGRRISWRTLPNSLVDQVGTVRFEPATGERGTVVYVDLTYSPPGGIVGETFAQMLNGVTAQQVKDDIRRFKNLMETGEVPTVEGQSSGRK